MSPTPPRDWMNWLGDVKGLAGPTKKLYFTEVKQFLGFAQRRMKRIPRMYDAWNVDLARKFFKTLTPRYSPTTVSNYHAALASVREFLFLQGRRPDNFQEIRETFRLLARTTRKKKRQHLKTRKVHRESNSLLGIFYQDIYHNDGLWDSFNTHIIDVKCKVKSGEPVVFHRNDITFLTSFMLCIALAANFKRSGNMALWSYDKASTALNNSLTAYRKKNPKASITSLPRRLDPANCVPAIIDVADSSKKKEVEYFCVPNPRDQRALLQYGEYIRPHMDPRCDAFFVNRKGKSLHGQVSFYIKWIGRHVGLKDFSVSAMRAEVETENFLENEAASRISAHLGHSKKTAEEYYVSQDKRHAVQASLAMLSLIEDRGERRFNETLPSEWDPVMHCGSKLGHFKAD